MRTTLVLKDELIAEAKKRAVERKSNVSEIVNEALIAAFRASPNAGNQVLFQMPCYRPASGQLVKTSPAEFDALLVAEQMEPYQS
ncbi:MAG: hypothetical protein NTW21_36690 [Verrucomicrobia bacterium]|nr:hypothetical protein [Verrucomicrobiota bacterium]